MPQFTANAGLQVPNLPDDATPLDFLKLFFTDDFWQLVVSETNRYAEQYLEQHGDTLPQHAIARSWRPVTVPEMKVFMSLHLLMGIVWKPELDHYWSTDAATSTPAFGKAMSRRRWMSIMQFLHFCDNSAPPNNDKLRKLRPLIELFVNRFQTVYMPSQRISIDEELVAWKGRLAFRQYIPSKRARFGVKIFALCEDSGYLFNFVIYVGKDQQTFPQQLINDLGSSGAVVAKLMEPLFNKGYTLFIDNWYSSLPLARFLTEHGTGVCGTIRKNRTGLPKAMLAYKRLKKGEFIFRSSGNTVLVKLQDTKEVHFLSTIHRPEIVATGKRDRENRPVKKLRIVHDYNKFMGGVDRNDEMIAFYSAARKTTKWYKKLATHIIEEGMLNAYTLYRKCGGKKTHYDFIRLALTALLEEGRTDAAQAQAAAGAAAGGGSRLTGRHFPSLVPATPKKAEPQKRCVVCLARGVRRDRRFCCLKCPGAPGLCAAPCFEIYHTTHNYGQLDNV